MPQNGDDGGSPWPGLPHLVSLASWLQSEGAEATLRQVVERTPRRGSDTTRGLREHLSWQRRVALVLTNEAAEQAIVASSPGVGDFVLLP